MNLPGHATREVVAELERIGVIAFTTTRAGGDFGLGDGDPEPAAAARWHRFATEMDAHVSRLASARQVHGTDVRVHGEDWSGWRREANADGHFSDAPGTACAVTVADCVPIFVAHPGGAVAILHSGWRGTAANMLAKGLARFAERDLPVADLLVHLGPAICGRCYRVGSDVFERLTGWPTSRERNVDLRALIAEQATALGIRQLSVSASCVRCDNDRFFSHRAGDAARQVAVIAAPARRP